MLLQQPHGVPEVQHQEKLRQRMDEKDSKQSCKTQTEVEHAKALLTAQTGELAQLVTEYV